MNDVRHLIVNADDFGLSSGINRGIIETCERGIVTSASLMVRGDAAKSAAEYARTCRRLGVGLHLDLGEWIYRDGAWAPLYQVVDAEDETAVENEIRRQLDDFSDLMRQPPTHLDSHQHAHRDDPLRSIATRMARELDVPLRHFCPSVRYCGQFYGQTARGEPMPEAIRVEALLALLCRLGPGITELACHPGYADDAATTYRGERANEVATLCDSRVRRLLSAERIELADFSSVTGLKGNSPPPTSALTPPGAM